VAAEMASSAGIACVIASGGRSGAIGDALAGRAVGTRFHPHAQPLSAFKLWLRYGKPSAGRLVIDAGARRAIERDGASLLPVGVTAVEGRFAAGGAGLVSRPPGAARGEGSSAAAAARPPP